MTPLCSGIIAVGAFLLGSIPFGYLVSLIRHIDIRRQGSGNIGATNVARSLGWQWGLAVGILDFLKSYLIALFAAQLGFSEGYRYFVMFMPVLGHIFSPWLGFKGGKGVSTVFGILAAMLGWPLFIIWLVVWVILLRLVRIMSLINITLALTIPLLFWWQLHSVTVVIFGGVITVTLWLTHHMNIVRLMQGTEPKLKL